MINLIAYINILLLFVASLLINSSHLTLPVQRRFVNAALVINIFILGCVF